MHSRTVFFVSDGTGITAETFGNAILAQFEMKPRHVRLPFIDTVDKAHQAVRQINHTADLEGNRPLVFTTVVDMDVLSVFRTQCKGVLLDMFGTFIAPLEHELGKRLVERSGRGLKLTPHGEILATACQHSFGALERALKRVSRGGGRSLHVRLPPTIAMKWLVPKLMGFQLQHPDLEL